MCVRLGHVVLRDADKELWCMLLRAVHHSCTPVTGLTPDRYLNAPVLGNLGLSGLTFFVGQKCPNFERVYELWSHLLPQKFAADYELVTNFVEAFEADTTYECVSEHLGSILKVGFDYFSLYT